MESETLDKGRLLHTRKDLEVRRTPLNTHQGPTCLFCLDLAIFLPGVWVGYALGCLVLSVPNGPMSSASGEYWI